MHTASVCLIESPSLPTLRLPKLSYTRRGLLALITLCASLCVFTGCTIADTKTAAQDIANAIPQVAPYIATAQAIVDSLDPTAAPLVDAGVLAVNTGLGIMQTALSNYAASPSATTWGAIVDAVTQTVNTNATTILNLAHVTNPDSRARALVVMGAIQTALLLILAIVQRVHDAVTSAKVKAAAQAAPLKISEYRQFLDKKQVETATGYPFLVAYHYEVSQGF